MKNEVRNEKSDPVVLARKRKNTSGVSSSPKVRAVIRPGIVNWAPPTVDGEDDQSSKAHIAWMQKERKKKNCNVDLVEKKMELTFSYRRKMINEEHHSLKSIKQMYPFLFKREQICINCKLFHECLCFEVIKAGSKFLTCNW